MDDGLKRLRREYIREFIEKEGMFYNQNRAIFLNAARGYITWRFLSDTAMGINPRFFSDIIQRLSLEKKVINFYSERSGNSNNTNGNGKGHRILEMLKMKNYNIS